MTSPISTMFLRDTRSGGAADQPERVAAALAGFISAATETVDVAIYDFRLSDTVAAGVVSALTSAAARGVTVRIGYDAGKPTAGTAADFAALQADPAPPESKRKVSRARCACRFETVHSQSWVRSSDSNAAPCQ